MTAADKPLDTTKSTQQWEDLKSEAKAQEEERRTDKAMGNRCVESECER